MTTSEDLELLLGGITDRFVEEAASARADAATARHNAFVTPWIPARLRWPVAALAGSCCVLHVAYHLRRSASSTLAVWRLR